LVVLILPETGSPNLYYPWPGVTQQHNSVYLFSKVKIPADIFVTFACRKIFFLHALLSFLS
jgi:hypothetical protein